MRMLLIDDDPLLIEALPTALKRRLPHSTITTALSAREGLDQLQVERFDVILTDLWMSGMHGDEFTTRMNTITECTPVILITGVIESPGEILPANLFAVVQKPFDVDVLAQTILSATANSNPS